MERRGCRRSTRRATARTGGHFGSEGKEESRESRGKGVQGTGEGEGSRGSGRWGRSLKDNELTRIKVVRQMLRRNADLNGRDAKDPGGERGGVMPRGEQSLYSLACYGDPPGGGEAVGRWRGRGRGI